jgi:hypothetical protein
MYTTLVPAYGRDYTSAKAVKAAWDAGQDFRVCEYGSPDDGRYVNRPQVPGRKFNVRYKRLMQLVVVQG